MIFDLEIRIVLPFDRLVYYPDDDDDTFFENPKFKSIRDHLGIHIDVINWVNGCHRILAGERHLHDITLFYARDKKSYILLDRYLDPVDQLDLINVGFKTVAEKGEVLRSLTRALNDESEYNIHYSEGSNAVFKIYPIDKESSNMYREKQKSPYLKGKIIKIKY